MISSGIKRDLRQRIERGDPGVRDARQHARHSPPLSDAQPDAGNRGEQESGEVRNSVMPRW